VLRIEDLRKSYLGPKGLVEAVAGLSLSVAAGELAVIQGPSGSGKTTLLLAAGGLLQPDSGRVCIDGQDLAALSAEERARFRAAHVGFVFQQFHLVPYLSVLDNVLVPALAFSAPGAGERARELIAHFGLQERAGHVPSQLSTG
jgi:putative ABC transport system ATP-binding protein